MALSNEYLGRMESLIKDRKTITPVPEVNQCCIDKESGYTDTRPLVQSCDTWE